MPNTENTATEKRDVYERVTSQIVNAIEQGVSNWRMPWHTSGKFAFSPINVASKKPYRGINTLCLWTAAQSKGYERGEWATYQQWQERKAQVRKGEKATTVVFWKFADNAAETQEDGAEHTASGSRLLFTRGYSVFNAAQVDGYHSKPTRIHRSNSGLKQLSSSFARSMPASYIRETGHSIRQITTPSPCRPSPRSSRQWITTARARIKPGTGHLKRADAIASWANGSAITPTAWRN
jgi:antirestriction protein ArdC